jgi:hypothetical protein
MDGFATSQALRLNREHVTRGSVVQLTINVHRRLQLTTKTDLLNVCANHFAESVYPVGAEESFRKNLCVGPVMEQQKSVAGFLNPM